MRTSTLLTLTERTGARISAHPGDGAGTVFRIAFPDRGDAVS